MVIDPHLDILIGALILEAAAGRFTWHLFHYIAHPVRFVGWGVGAAQRASAILRTRWQRRLGGMVLCLGAIALALLTGLAATRLLRSAALPWGIGTVGEVFLISIFLSQYELHERVRRVMLPLARGRIDRARRAARHIVGRDLDRAGEGAIARAAVESTAENFNDAVVAPALAYALFGLPGLFAYKTISTMDSMIGYRWPPAAGDFGMVAARIDDLAAAVPARLSALLAALAAGFVPGARISAALKCVRRDASSHASVNAGWPEAAFAGALGFSLAGPRRYAGRRVDDPFIGDGRRRLKAPDIARGLRLYRAACAVHIAGYGLLALARGG